MPELPEVETVRRGLAPAMVGRHIKSVRVARSDLRRPVPIGLAERLTGAMVLAVERRAKYLVWPLSTGDSLIAHLGMTGRFTVGGGPLGDYVNDTRLNPIHDHLRIETDDGRTIIYNDPRRFGFVDLWETEQLGSYPAFAGLGPEPLSPGFNPKFLKAAFVNRRSAVKAALLDQGVVAGLGNIYVAEALFRAGVSPIRPAASMRLPAIRRLVFSVDEVISEAIEAGGSSISDFAASDGVRGRFQMAFRVYGREGESCSVCRRSIVRIVQAGRSTFYCSHCQR